MKRMIVYMSFFVIIVTGLVCGAHSNQLYAKSVSFNIIVDGVAKIFKNDVVVINDNTYVPLREVSENLGMSIEWDDRSKTITINSKSNVENILIPFEKEGLWGYMNNKGETIVEPVYADAKSFSNERALVRKSRGSNGEYGFIDESGNIVIECSYYDAYSFSDDVALVSLASSTDENRWTYIDKQGNRLFDKDFILAKSFSEGYAAVLKKGYGSPMPPSVSEKNVWSYIDKTGKFVTDLEFEEAYDFCDGYAKVKVDGKWGIIDTDFNFIISDDSGDVH